MKRAIAQLFLLLAITAFGAAQAHAQEHDAAVPTGHTADVESSHAEKTSGELVPVSQSDQKQAFIQAVWVVIIFTILLAILYPTAWKGVLTALKGREQRIRQSITDAEAAHAKAQQVLAEYNRQLAAAEDRVREMLAKAHADAEQLAASIRENAGKEADDTRKRALADIENAKKQAIDDIHTQAVELSTSIAEKIIRRNLNPEDQRELVRASLDQFGASRRN